jgi:hypothetical protein
MAALRRQQRGEAEVLESEHRAAVADLRRRQREEVAELDLEHRQAVAAERAALDIVRAAERDARAAAAAAERARNSARDDEEAAAADLAALRSAHGAELTAMRARLAAEGAEAAARAQSGAAAAAMTAAMQPILSAALRTGDHLSSAAAALASALTSAGARDAAGTVTAHVHAAMQALREPAASDSLLRGDPLALAAACTSAMTALQTALDGIAAASPELEVAHRAREARQAAHADAGERAETLLASAAALEAKLAEQSDAAATAARDTAAALAAAQAQVSEARQHAASADADARASAGRVRLLEADVSREAAVAAEQRMLLTAARAQAASLQADMAGLQVSLHEAQAAAAAATAAAAAAVSPNVSAAISPTSSTTAVAVATATLTLRGQLVAAETKVSELEQALSVERSAGSASGPRQEAREAEARAASLAGQVREMAAAAAALDARAQTAEAALGAARDERGALSGDAAALRGQLAAAQAMADGEARGRQLAEATAAAHAAALAAAETALMEAHAALLVQQEAAGLAGASAASVGAGEQAVQQLRGEKAVGVSVELPHLQSAQPPPSPAPLVQAAKPGSPLRWTAETTHVAPVPLLAAGGTTAAGATARPRPSTGHGGDSPRSPRQQAADERPARAGSPLPASAPAHLGAVSAAGMRIDAPSSAMTAALQACMAEVTSLSSHSAAEAARCEAFRRALADHRAAVAARRAALQRDRQLWKADAADVVRGTAARTGSRPSTAAGVAHQSGARVNRGLPEEDEGPAAEGRTSAGGAVLQARRALLKEVKAELDRQTAAVNAAVARVKASESWLAARRMAVVELQALVDRATLVTAQAARGGASLAAEGVADADAAALMAAWRSGVAWRNPVTLAGVAHPPAWFTEAQTLITAARELAATLESSLTAYARASGAGTGAEYVDAPEDLLVSPYVSRDAGGDAGLIPQPASLPVDARRSFRTGRAAEEPPLGGGPTRVSASSVRNGAQAERQRIAAPTAPPPAGVAPVPLAVRRTDAPPSRTDGSGHARQLSSPTFSAISLATLGDDFSPPGGGGGSSADITSAASVQSDKENRRHGSRTEKRRRPAPAGNTRVRVRSVWPRASDDAARRYGHQHARHARLRRRGWWDDAAVPVPAPGAAGRTRLSLATVPLCAAARC